MGFSAEVVKVAQAQLAAEKENRESQYRQHLAEAYRQVPQLLEIDKQLRQTMARAVRSAFSLGQEAGDLLEAAKQENQKLRAQRESLIAASFPEGFLVSEPVCRTCGGSGYLGSQMCTCLKDLCIREQRKRLGRLTDGMEDFSQFCLDYYPDRADRNLGVNIRAVMERTFQTCRKYAQTFHTGAESLLFTGDTGLGKTFLSACIARSVADAGYSVLYESASSLFSVLERARFSSDEASKKAAEEYAACDLLILDDLGTEMPGQFTNAALYALMNDRLMLQKPTIISTNLTSDDLQRRYTSQITSRLRGNFRRVPFLGEDIRVSRNRGIL